MAIEFWDLSVWIFNETAWMFALMIMNFLHWRLVLTKSYIEEDQYSEIRTIQIDRKRDSLTLAMTLTASICPALAFFLISMMIFFSCCSILAFSLSSSRMALSRARLFLRSISSGVIFLPNNHSILAVSLAKSSKDT